MAVAKIYPDSDERGRGNKSAVTAHFPMVAKRRLEEARAVLRYAPELAELVMAGSRSLRGKKSPVAGHFPNGRGKKAPVAGDFISSCAFKSQDVP